MNVPVVVNVHVRGVIMNEIIYGKAGLQKLVCIEPQDGCIELFYEDEPGLIRSEFQPNQSWLLSPTNIDGTFTRLKGELFYKYGRKFDAWDDLISYRKSHGWKKFFGPNDMKEQAAIKDGYSCFLQMTPADVSVLSFDIETTGLDAKKQDAQVLLISTAYRASSEVEKRLFSYDEYNSPKEMIESFCTYVRDKNPSFLVGHNIIQFDLPYLNTIANKNGTNLRLGRNDSAISFDSYERKFRVDGSRDLHYHNCSVYGREVIDTYLLAIKSDIGKKYESYGLKNIIKQEGLEIVGRTFYDASKIRINYLDPQEWKLIKQYCLDDATDSLMLYDKFIPPFFYMCQAIAKGSMQSVILSATGSQLNSIMCRAYLQDGHSLPKADDQVQFQGAISFGVPGLYKNACRFDFLSMYPSIMLQYSLGPGDKDPKNYFLFMLNHFRDERLKNKKLARETGEERYSHLEQSGKVFVNSAYGALGAPGLLFNNSHNAAEVTRYGRELLKVTIEWATSNKIEYYKDYYNG